MAGCLTRMRIFCLLALVSGVMGCMHGDETISGYVDRDAIWHLQELDGVEFPAQASVQFPETGQVTGSGPCNRYSAIQTAPYPWISVEAVAATKRACPDLQQEQQFFEMLQSMSLAEVSGDALLLSDDTGRQMLFRVDQP